VVIVVAGAGRKVGKTTFIENLIRENEEAGWTAVKITPHDHPPTRHGRADTDRYLAAGAREAVLIRAAGGAEAWPQVRAIIANNPNVIIESKRILKHLQPDLWVYIDLPGRR
jgi:molybdopterin-guanine dinucleotide biosynthesis protein